MHHEVNDVSLGCGAHSKGKNGGCGSVHRLSHQVMIALIIPNSISTTGDGGESDWRQRRDQTLDCF